MNILLYICTVKLQKYLCMENTNTEKIPVFPTFRQMEVGEKRTWPLMQVATIRSNTSLFNLMTGRKYTTHVNREKGVIEVTREE